MAATNLWAAWIGIFLGLESGTVQGLFFHREDWLGGYDAWPRRLMRLGHISFFGIAFLNLAYANTVALLGGDADVPAASMLLTRARRAKRAARNSPCLENPPPPPARR